MFADILMLIDRLRAGIQECLSRRPNPQIALAKRWRDRGMAQGTEDHDDKSETVADRSIELEKLRLDRYKARLDFWKFIWVSGCAAVLIAAIPPSFQFATA